MIKLSQEEQKEFIAQRYLDFDFESFHIKKPDFEKTLSKELSSILKLSDSKFLQEWVNELKIPNTTVEDFKEKNLKTNSGNVLLGIRFLGMDISKPFVNVWADFSLEKEFDKVVAFAKDSFQIFNPKHIRFWAHPKSNLALENQQHICQNYLVGNIEQITKTNLPENYKNVELQLVKDLSFYEWYKKLYHDFHKNKPELKAFVTINEKYIFEDSIQQNLCYFIKYDNKKIGLISAEKDDYFGVPSLYMNEIVLNSEFKGLKLASASQRKLIEINKNDFHFIWGNIDSKNIPSTKNALRIGRKIISSEVLLPL